MIGQGSPNTSRGRSASFTSGLVCWACRLLPAIATALCLRGAIAAEETVQLRIAWGGGPPSLWEGVIAVSEGTLSEPRALGIEADGPGSMWLQRGPLPSVSAGEHAKSPLVSRESDHLVIRQRSPRTYDGVDLLVTAPPEANLRIALWKPQGQDPTAWITVPLAGLCNGVHATELDDQGNRLLVSRAPGDKLPATLARSSLVFAPGETLKFEFRPRLLPVDPDTELRIRIELAEGRGSGGQLIAEHTVVAGQRTPMAQEVCLPEKEGVYDLVLTARHASLVRWPPPVPGKEPLATRRIQLLVLSPDPPDVPPGVASQWTEVEAIDPANPKWWEQLLERLGKLPQPSPLSRLHKGPLGNGNSQTWKHPLGQFVRLGSSRNEDDVPWEAYTLPIDRPGRPHLLEFEYPGDVPQTVGVSIIEPNEAGAVLPVASGMPTGPDSGVELAEEVPGRRDATRSSHRLIFWPRTKSPVVLITNRRDGSPAVYGKIRVLCGGEHLPRSFPADGPRPERLLAAYLDRPLFPQNFSASQARIVSSKVGFDDWVTFYQGGTRLVEYLNHVGFGGLMISVLADGSTIYPSRILEPTPRYETGVFLEEGQDPVRKDVLEMLFRLFDRQGLKLIPALQFAAPLPELEAELRGDGQNTEGIRWVGKDGKTWLETYRPVRGMAPYYNVLHWRVQQTMLAAIREVVTRYGHHPSFAGLAIQLSAHGYAQLPGPAWGMDDVTVAHFEKDTGVQVPGLGPERFARRAQFLAPPTPGDAPYPDQWLHWRADELHGFYRQIHEELAARRPDARLYLAGADMLAGAELQRQLRPALPQRMTIAEAMLRVGVDIRHYGQDGGMVLLRPERIASQGSLARQAVDLEIRQMPDIDRAFEGLPTPGSLFFHPPQELPLASFDQKSPFQPSYTWLVTQPVPSGWQNRRRFVHSLATLDSQVMIDGGWLLPMGQEDSLRNVVAAYRRLPAVRFQRLLGQYGSDPAQPVVIRYATCAGGTYVYLINDAPFATVVGINVDCPKGTRLEELSGLRQVSPLAFGPNGVHWTVQLEPYDLVAVRFSDPRVTLLGPQVHLRPEVQAELEARIEDLQNRTAALLRYGPPRLEVLENASFEQPPGGDGRIPGWAQSIQPGASVQLDTEIKWDGEQAVKMASRGPEARLKSRPFDPPPTGRLTVAVRLRAAKATPQPSLRLGLEGKLKGAPFSRDVLLRVGTDWSQPFVHTFDDLPLEGLSQLRVRFDFLGPGELWIDDVQLCSLLFDETERIALMKLIAPADPKRQVRDCIHLLEGYWPRFLRAYVPLGEMLTRRPEPARQPPKQPQSSPGFFDRLKDVVPRKLRWF